MGLLRIEKLEVVERDVYISQELHTIQIYQTMIASCGEKLVCVSNSKAAKCFVSILRRDVVHCKLQTAVFVDGHTGAKQKLFVIGNVD